ncbi:hypothetical protein [Streptomyces endophytica]|uniref:SCP2 domain-containing protein n=1 Tax=Streptomyces endophytica TaxID=2991496 RepID=A0ABY6P6N9_9ACTN|nr:hypothetical protein [Streptomyces endophytica]UZJ29449.1 hypothetical protein OJ254_01815 [Streptomyces endophytica]
MQDDVWEKASLSIESIESVTPGPPGTAGGEAVCVVRCIDGTARLGMVFRHCGSGSDVSATEPRLTLTAIEWYGKQVEQLDTVHSGKVTLAGSGVATLAKRDVLDSAPGVTTR